LKLFSLQVERSLYLHIVSSFYHFVEVVDTFCCPSQKREFLQFYSQVEKRNQREKLENKQQRQDFIITTVAPAAICHPIVFIMRFSAEIHLQIRNCNLNKNKCSTSKHSESLSMFDLVWELIQNIIIINEMNKCIADF